MKKNGKDVQWVVQRNLTSAEDLKKLRSACEKNDVNCIEVDIIPFTKQLPDIDNECCNIYYGSTTFNNLVYENEQIRAGLFFNPETFSIENYIDKWGKYMLNNEAMVTTFEALMHYNYDGEKLLFIRPNDDSKSFSGEVKKFKSIADWYEQIKNIADDNFSPQTKIIVSEPYNIKHEWRLWIVEKKVISASRYRADFRLAKESGCPPEVVSFAESRCLEYTPHDVFVMDIGLCGNDYYIIECGCMNGAGFYHADITEIVSAVTKYFRKVCSQ